LISVEEMVGCSMEEVFIMRLFTVTMTGFVCIGMTVLALANPVMLPKHPGYPSSGDFANDTGRNNLTYSQSMEAAAKSGDTTMGTMSIDPRNSGISDPLVVNPFKGTAEQPTKEGIRMPMK
jgi:hypothetical protein